MTTQKIIDHNGDIIWVTIKPDGTPRKLMEVTKLTALGWKAKIELVEGIERTYEWFLKNNKNIIPQS